MDERTTRTEAQRVTFADRHARPAEDRAYWRGWRDAMCGSSLAILVAILLLAILRAI